jgi:ParB family chromosome partitioning protein
MSETVKMIELKRIHPSKLNPRLEVNLERLSELANSIKEVGLLEPIIVRPVNNEFEVVVGERRYRASQQAGLEKVTSIVRDYTDDEVVQLNLIENVQREELSGVEKGRVCKFLLENYPDKYPTPTTIARKVGVSTDTIALWLRTVEIIPKQVQKLVAPATVSGEVPEGKIDYQTAIKIGRSIKEPEKQVEIIKKLAAKHLPVKERMQIIKKAVEEPEKPLEQVFEEASVGTPYELEFTAEDKAPILNGLKTQTSRLDAPDPKVKADATVQAVLWEPHFADLRIVSIERKRLKYYDEEDAKREGGYTLKQFKQLWKEAHREWDEGQLVYVIRFEKAK